MARKRSSLQHTFGTLHGRREEIEVAVMEPQIMQSGIIEAEILEREAFSVVGLKYRGQNESGEEIAYLWKELAEGLEGIEGPFTPKSAYGVIDNYDDESAEFEYVAGFAVGEPYHVPLGMARWEIPQQTWAVFRCTSACIDETYREIYKVWLPQSGYKRAEGPEFEQYSTDFLKGEDDAEVRICIPIKEA
ncbi:MAG: GyrI-like domain-containing protein [Chloroflexota bacterium]